MVNNKIFSNIVGQGEPLVFLHGWGVTSKLFEEMANYLKDAWECHLIDLPGFGNSQKPDDVWGTKEYASCINDYLNEHHIINANIIGHSVGGRIALRLGVYFPENINSLILISSAGIKSKKFLFRRIKIFTLKKISKIAKFFDKFICKNYLKRKYASKFASEDYKNAGNMKDIFLKIVNEDQEDELGKIDKPTLIIWGDEDTETPVDMAHTLNKKIKNSQLKILKGKDHFPFIRSGASLCAFQVKEFLKNI